ncbi:NAD(P)H-binding protein [Actinospica durhamensis]|uniref:NAD(P)H-binding protein n=1 Tax=Actinospica durhamensis TaxID=1508375 RepID=A0A941IVN9_9ACTN|nr:NAD(P)H-binding protein [Actinospica durhamensis]MBR7837536.1 NAD(P)H-binding protein [Actinospica durhamensis]
MSDKILVTGGTGTLGRHLVPLLRQADREVRVLTRHSRPTADGVQYVACDLLTHDDAGLDAALDGVTTVVHLAGGPKGDDVATRHLVRAAVRAQVSHLVFVSVIAADLVPIGYFQRKLASEQIVAASGVPYTLLRAAQFHDLALFTARKMAKLPVLLAPGGVRWQPVDSGEVAARLAELALDEPAGRVSDLAGPRVYRLDELVEGYLRAVGKRRPRLPVHVPGKAGRVYRSGENLSLIGTSVGRRTWEEFLAAQVGAAAPEPVVQAGPRAAGL